MVRKIQAIAPIVTGVVAVLAFCIFICWPTSTADARQEAEIQIAGKVLATEPAAFIDSNLLIVPVREVAGALGADVSWDAGKQAVTVVKGGNQIVMIIGDPQAMVNGVNVDMKFSPLIVDSRTMAPVRVLAAGLQVPISWDNAAKTAHLENPVLLAGSSVDFPPFEFKADNEFVGFEMDLLDAMEEVLGEEIAVQDIRFDQLLPSLDSGQVDLIISGLTITEQRKELFGFTIPYFDYGEIILTPKGSNQDMDLDDLAGKKVAFQGGSNSQEIVNELVENYPDTLPVAYDTLGEIWSAMEASQIDVAVVPHPPTAYYLTSHSASNLQIAGSVFDIQQLGIAVQKGNQQLLDTLNLGLDTLYKNGTYDRIYEKWFGPKR